MHFYKARLAIVFIGILVLSWFIPQTYWRVTRSDYFGLSATYSPTREAFVIRESTAVRSVLRTEDGHILNGREMRMALPFMYRMDLQKWNKFPITIGEKTFDFNQASQTQIGRLRPRMFNDPMPGVTVLLESEPEGASLELPTDLMIVTDTGLKFVRADKKEVLTEKAKRFNDALASAGIVFPLKAFGNNPDPLKPFDEGAFMVDAKNQVAQLKMVRGEPIVRVMPYSAPEGTRALTVSESALRHHYGTLMTPTAVYLMMYDDTLQPLPLRDYRAESDTLTLWTTPLTHSMMKTRFSRDEMMGDFTATATDRDFKVIAETTVSYPSERREREARVQEWVNFFSPMMISQLTPTRSGVFFDVSFARAPMVTLLGNLVALALYLAIQWVLTTRGNNGNRRRQAFLRENALAAGIIAVFGLPALVATLTAGSLMTSTKRV